MAKKNYEGYETLIVQLYSLKYNEQLDFREILRRLYIDEGKSIRTLAKEWSVSPGTIHRWLIENYIPRRERKIKCE